jgi:serine/threonine protein kinase
MIGKPAFVSPEQALTSPLNIDVRSDVYSLGALLYELLTGTTPIERDRFAEASEDEIRRLIRDFDPPRPSDRAKGIESRPNFAASRKASPAKLSKMLRGKVDCIVMKAIEKDRDRRYQTAEALAQDIKRYLTGQRVFACPPSFGDRIRGYFRRGQ